MKKLMFLISMMVFSCLNVMAQDKDDEIQTLFGSADGKIHHSGFGAPVIKYTQVNGETSIMVGGRLGWTINRVFTLGIGGYGMVYGPEIDYSKIPGATPETLDMGFGYGGLFLEYIYNSNSSIHFTANTLIGAGGTMYADWFKEDHDMDEQPWAAYFVVEPGVSVEFNLLKFFRIGAEVSYRITSKVKDNSYYRMDPGLDNIKLDGLSAGLVFKFGTF